jgi:hypothetical protein
MSRRLTISELLNPDRSDQALEATALSVHLPALPFDFTSAGPHSAPQQSVGSNPISLEYNVYINRQTTLVTLFRYGLDAFVEYPESSEHGPVGHLFAMDPDNTDNWNNPALNIVYSRGEPSGRTKRPVLCPLLVDIHGAKVPCWERHTTCM